MATVWTGPFDRCRRWAAPAGRRRGRIRRDRGARGHRVRHRAADPAFHCTAITDGSRRIEVGAVVAFVVAAGRLGRLEARLGPPAPRRGAPGLDPGPRRAGVRCPLRAARTGRRSAGSWSATPSLAAPMRRVRPSPGTATGRPPDEPPGPRGRSWLPSRRPRSPSRPSPERGHRLRPGSGPARPASRWPVDLPGSPPAPAGSARSRIVAPRSPVAPAPWSMSAVPTRPPRTPDRSTRTGHRPAPPGDRTRPSPAGGGDVTPPFGMSSGPPVWAVAPPPATPDPPPRPPRGPRAHPTGRRTAVGPGPSGVDPSGAPPRLLVALRPTVLGPATDLAHPGHPPEPALGRRRLTAGPGAPRTEGLGPVIGLVVLVGIAEDVAGHVDDHRAVGVLLGHHAEQRARPAAR